jgi:hypothetical protein
MGYGSRVTEVGGSQKPHKPHIYFNKRAEMWGNMRDFLKIGCINNDLRHELMGPIDRFVVYFGEGSRRSISHQLCIDKHTLSS